MFQIHILYIGVGSEHYWFRLLAVIHWEMIRKNQYNLVYKFKQSIDNGYVYTVLVCNSYPLPTVEMNNKGHLQPCLVSGNAWMRYRCCGNNWSHRPNAKVRVLSLLPLLRVTVITPCPVITGALWVEYLSDEAQCLQCLF